MYPIEGAGARKEETAVNKTTWGETFYHHYAYSVTENCFTHFFAIKPLATTTGVK